MNLSSRSLAFPRAASAAAVVLLAALLGTGSARAVQIEWVQVGNPGNDLDYTTFLGQVDYLYAITKYEFTNEQYIAYLNAVDPQGLSGNVGNGSSGVMPMNGIYRTSMNTNASGGITFVSGNANGNKYVLKTVTGTSRGGVPSQGSYADKPVTTVGWFDIARVANWLHNGGQTYQFSSPNVPGYDGISLTGSTVIQDGAYTLNGVTSGAPVLRNPGAIFWMPNYDEWYKAAYFDPTLDDPLLTTSGSYWQNTTRTNGNLVGVEATLEGAGFKNGVTPVTTGDFTNIRQGDFYFWNGGRNTSDVGTNGGPSAYGTFDQGGNVREIIENADFDGASWRWLAQGGNYNGGQFLTQRNQIDDNRQVLESRSADAGFRLASVPEPSTWALCGGVVGWVAWAAVRRRPRRNRRDPGALAA